MTVSKTYTAGEVTVRYEADTIDELFALVTRFETDSDDGWIPWDGGEWPVSGDSVKVEVKFQNGECDSGMARYYRWSHIASDFDIVAYRVVS